MSTVSLVVPVGPDDDIVYSGLLADLAEMHSLKELLLVGCQPHGQTVALPAKARWLITERGRARQLNHGALAATGEWLWFVHADSRLNTKASQALSAFIQGSAQRLGYFRLRFANDGPIAMPINAWAANWRSRLFQLPFGDQGLIIHRDDFQRLSGFDADWPRGEDLDFVIRARAAGIKLTEIPAFISTSARRYREYGWLKTTFTHLCLTYRQRRQARQRL